MQGAADQNTNQGIRNNYICNNMPHMCKLRWRKKETSHTATHLHRHYWRNAIFLLFPFNSINTATNPKTYMCNLQCTIWD